MHCAGWLTANMFQQPGLATYPLTSSQPCRSASFFQNQLLEPLALPVAVPQTSSCAGDHAEREIRRPPLPGPHQPPHHQPPPAAAHTPAEEKASESDAANTDGADGAETTVDRVLTLVKSSTREELSYDQENYRESTKLCLPPQLRR